MLKSRRILILLAIQLMVVKLDITRAKEKTMLSNIKPTSLLIMILKLPRQA